MYKLLSPLFFRYSFSLRALACGLLLSFFSAAGVSAVEKISGLINLDNHQYKTSNIVARSIWIDGRELHSHSILAAPAKIPTVKATAEHQKYLRFIKIFATELLPEKLKNNF